jgi:carbon storage regulator
MLVLTRKTGERIVIGGDIQVTVLRVQGNRVKLGVMGPSAVPIQRGELHARSLNLDTAKQEELEGVSQ